MVLSSDSAERQVLFHADVERGRGARRPFGQGSNQGTPTVLQMDRQNAENMNMNRSDTTAEKVHHGAAYRSWALSLLMSMVICAVADVLARGFVADGINSMVLLSYCLPAVWWAYLFMRARSFTERVAGWATFAAALAMTWVGLVQGCYI